jgi:solute carrier family 25 (mitochondrial uncoupling protein), member 8/9
LWLSCLFSFPFVFVWRPPLCPDATTKLTPFSPLLSLKRNKTPPQTQPNPLQKTNKTKKQIRAAILTASQCATYDAAKRRLQALTHLPPDSVALQAACAMLTGLASTTATQPVDVVKTHMFVGGGGGGKKGGAGGVTGAGGASAAATGATGAAGATGAGATTMTATARRILDAHGVQGFFRGWTANYARLGPMTVLIFVTTEWCRTRLGMEAL